MTLCTYLAWPRVLRQQARTAWFYNRRETLFENVFLTYSNCAYFKFKLRLVDNGIGNSIRALPKKKKKILLRYGANIINDRLRVFAYYTRGEMCYRIDVIPFFVCTRYCWKKIACLGVNISNEIIYYYRITIIILLLSLSSSDRADLFSDVPGAL